MCPVKGTHPTREENREMAQITKKKFRTSIVEHTQHKHSPYSVERNAKAQEAKPVSCLGSDSWNLQVCASQAPPLKHCIKQTGGGCPLSICK